MRIMLSLIILMIVTTAFFFSLLNATPVHISLGPWGLNLPLSLALYLCLLVGMVLGWSVGFMSRIRMRWQIGRLKKE